MKVVILKANALETWAVLYLFLPPTIDFWQYDFLPKICPQYDSTITIFFMKTIPVLF
jgi:hypothetical protein